MSKKIIEKIIGGESEFKTSQEWFSSFTEEEQEVIIEMIMNNPDAAVYGRISTMDKKPYPFNSNSWNYFCRRVRGAVNGDSK